MRKFKEIKVTITLTIPKVVSELGANIGFRQYLSDLVGFWGWNQVGDSIGVGSFAKLSGLISMVIWASSRLNSERRTWPR
jgi:hypothetical protein